MAVVQISRIQHRRGRKNQGSGLPQLASGEIGWAIDTQELYIGNGAVSEGAPQVGNTKILTESDDLLELVGQYAYKRGEIQTGTAISSPVERTIQAKLDDIVNVRDFGANGDGTDQTTQIQRAIDQLFINSATKGLSKSRVTLVVPAGEYQISGGGLRVPPNATIIGAGKDKTVFTSSTTNPPAHIFKTVNSRSVPGTYADPSTTDSTNMATNIVIKGMSLQHTSNGGALKLENCKDSVFEDLDISTGGEWTNGTPITDVGDPASNLVGIFISNGSVATATSDNNSFNNLTISGMACAVYSDYDINYNKFNTGKIENCGLGFVLGADITEVPPVGKSNGPQHTLVTNYTFDAVDKQGIYVRLGNYNRSESNIYLNVGRDNSSSVVVEPVIEFYRTADTDSIADAGHFDMDNNISVNDYFQRTEELTVDSLYDGQDYLPEVHGSKRLELKFPVRRTLGALLEADTVIRLPADQQRGTIELEYTYRAETDPGNVFQSGLLSLVYNKLNGEVVLTDDYVYTGNPTKAGRLTFETNGTFQNSQTEIHITALNEIIDELSPVDDELEFTIKYIN